jgi:hypothetical protein
MTSVVPFMSTSSPTKSMYSFDKAKFTYRCALNPAQPVTITALNVGPPAIGGQILYGRAAYGPHGVLTGNAKR